MDFAEAIDNKGADTFIFCLLSRNGQYLILYADNLGGIPPNTVLSGGLMKKENKMKLC
jgi:hypothetical protein